MLRIELLKAQVEQLKAKAGQVPGDAVEEDGLSKSLKELAKELESDD